MDTFLAIASRREVRAYDRRPIDDEVVRRILDAGRLSGSAGNQQPWQFVLVSGEAQAALADAVSEPSNIRGAALVVTLLVGGEGHVSFDAGRCAQNMLLAAWNEGVGGSPNGLADRDAANAIVGVPEDWSIEIVLSFGYPGRPRDPDSRSAVEWSGRARRKRLAELVERRSRPASTSARVEAVEMQAPVRRVSEGVGFPRSFYFARARVRAIETGHPLPGELSPLWVGGKAASAMPSADAEPDHASSSAPLAVPDDTTSSVSSSPIKKVAPSGI
jgi:nitroreductase